MSTDGRHTGDGRDQADLAGTGPARGRARVDRREPTRAGGDRAADLRPIRCVHLTVAVIDIDGRGEGVRLTDAVDTVRRDLDVRVHHRQRLTRTIRRRVLTVTQIVRPEGEMA